MTLRSTLSFFVSVLACGALIEGRLHAQSAKAETDPRAPSPLCARRASFNLVSHASCPNAVLGNDYSAFPSLSGDGRFVTFFSAANNLVPGDSGASEDVFIFDRLQHRVKRLSDGIGSSRDPNISKTGRFVTFYSTSNDLVDGDTNGKGDVFVRDLLTNEIERVSIGEGGVEGDGDAIASHFDPTQRPDISGDGRYVVFVSQAKNLVPGDSNGKDDVFVRDRLKKATRRVSVSSRGTQANAHCTAPQMSDDGSVIAFESAATNLIDGRVDREQHADIFVQVQGKTLRVSESPRHVPGNAPSQRPAVSGDGTTIAFASAASNLTSGDTNQPSDIFVYDLKTRGIELISRAPDGSVSNGFSNGPALSDDGQRVVFDSIATNLAPGSSGKIATYIVDRAAHSIRLVSANGSAVADASTHYRPQISGDGKFVAFDTSASNLLPFDTNRVTDVFVRALE